MDIPRNKLFPRDSVQCDDCGGCGCTVCGQDGWLTPRTHPKGRRCYRCDVPLPPDHIAVYCSDACAEDNATD
ncbi:MAG: hypothetical protein AMXMBFR44_4080 [Candidatus Campbellbacteria bacterium]